MKITYELAQWLEKCGISIFSHSTTSSDAYVEVNDTMTTFLSRGEFIYNLLQFIAKNSNLTEALSFFKNIKLQNSLTPQAHIENWQQLFKILPFFQVHCTTSLQQGLLNASLFFTLFILVY